MSKIKTGGLDQYGAEPFEQQQFEKASVEGVKGPFTMSYHIIRRQAVCECALIRDTCIHVQLGGDFVLTL